MENGNRNGFMEGLRRSPSSLAKDVFGLGLTMQPIDSSSYPCKRNTLTVLQPPPLPLYHHRQQQQQQQQAGSSGGFTVFNGDDEGGGNSGGGGGSNFCNTSYQVSSLSDIYYVAGLGLALGDAVSVSARTFLPKTTVLDTIGAATSFKTSGEGMPLFSKAPVFTASQRQELEKQTIICKYMMASLPVPPQLLLSLSKNQFPGPVHQSSSEISAASGLELRFSSRSDPEPWRCRRTDGKKWRCSRNVTHGQKYCERHAHKSRSRSRKPVEVQSKITATNDSYSYTNNFPSSNITQPNSHLPSMGSVASCDPTRGIELLSEGAGGTIPFWACNQQWQHQMHSSTTTMDLTTHNEVEHNKEEGCVHQVRNRDNVGIPRWENRHSNSRIGLPPNNINGETMQTRGFIDAWSTADKRGRPNKVGKKDCVSSSSAKKTPISSLTLSIPGENEDDDEHHHEQGGGYPNVGTRTRMIRWERSKKDGNNNNNNSNNVAGEWINAVTGMGGPLGEALCLGIASNTKGPTPSLLYHHGYSSSNNNNNTSISTITTSGCSRSSCEDPW